MGRGKKYGPKGVDLNFFSKEEKVSQMTSGTMSNTFLDAQKDWIVFVVAGTEVAKTFEFKNVYNISEFIHNIVKSEVGKIVM
ncbi:hypothetical protein [Phosphitispora fastidiosa]|uniref:hypothetical protein n=1 Tax=Phosphitispora fastidiosa TaxID=2837202 RepID=UPI001E5273A0|nr:hypothetical protein [Phosphitispora fastidiosa]MBU7007161.1 hypothetical protein [Phosphitispora fastidiosa]